MDTLTLLKNNKKVNAAIGITALTMIIELVAGQITGSMALLADGWHMASHVGALSISSVAYWYTQKHKNDKRFKNGSVKILHLSGYTSAIVLAFISLLMIVESVQRLLNPVPIDFMGAIPVAIIGLIVNLGCAKILHHKHSHHDEHHDHNLRAAYLHVLADALTSIFAIFALITGLLFNLIWLDPILGIVGSLVIMKWSWNLAFNSSMDLLDFKKSQISKQKDGNILHEATYARNV